jgi:hypothetical protein
LVPSGARWNLERGWQQLARSFSLGNLALLQRGFTQTFAGGAAATLTTEVKEIDSVTGLLTAIPSGLANALWAPFPWQWGSRAGETGAFRQVAAIETLAILTLTPWLLRAVIRGLRSNRDAAWLVILFATGTAAVMGMTVASAGILFRLRLQFLFPLLVIGGAYGIAGWRLARLLTDDMAGAGDSVVLTGDR